MFGCNGTCLFAADATSHAVAYDVDTGLVDSTVLIVVSSFADVTGHSRANMGMAGHGRWPFLPAASRFNRSSVSIAVPFVVFALEFLPGLIALDSAFGSASDCVRCFLSSSCLSLKYQRFGM